MIRQYLSNTNENTIVSILQKVLEVNKACTDPFHSCHEKNDPFHHRAIFLWCAFGVQEAMYAFG